MALYDLDNRIRAFGEKRRLNVGTAAKPRWIDNVHAGDDYAATYGNDRVYAVSAGTVTVSGWSSTYGWHLKVRRSDGVVIGYHSLNATPAIGKGAQVKPGDYIGLTGKSASGASGNHVHIQADTAAGKPINPRPYIDGAAFNPLPNTASSNAKPFEEDDMYTDEDRATMKAVYDWIRGDKPEAGTTIARTLRDTAEIAQNIRDLNVPDTRNRIGNIQYALGLVLERNGKAAEFVAEFDDVDLAAIAKTVNDERDRRERERLGK